ncbi:MAG: endolytic transglycosylase MltG [Culicoidibacterales bacterium]
MEKNISRKNNRKKKRTKKVVIILIIITTLIVAIFGSIGYAYQNYMILPVDTTKTSEFELFEFESKETIRNIADQLAQKGIVKKSLALQLRAKQRKIDYIAAPGKYEFKKSMTLDEILDIIEQGRTAYDFQIPISDGSDIDSLLDAYSTTENERMAMETTIEDIGYITKLKQRFTFLPDEILQDGMRHRLEGFLGNGTYYLKMDDPITVLIEKALEQFEKEYRENNLENKLKQQGKSLYEIVTMASVVRGEVFSGDTENQKMVAGVFYNRIEEGMKFQSDVTVGYSLGLKELNYTQEQLDNPSPYNTYAHEGLPKGPINNPGFDVIEASLAPTKNDYYYFLADVCDDGKGEFGKIYYAKDFRQHNAYSAEFLACIR